MGKGIKITYDKFDILKRILIICPNLEPIQCGVSDYVSILKDLFVETKNEVFCFAINDNYSENIIETEYTIRISQSIPTSIKIKKLVYVINKFKPDYIYFNYVSYGYNKKGTPFWLLKVAESLANFKISIFIYFHELWIGRYKHESLKSKCLGFFQQFIILNFISILKPSKVFTNTDIFRDVLTKKKIEVTTIPVFNNISCKIKSPSYPINSIYNFDHSTLVFCFFGTIFPENEFVNFYNIILKQQQNLNLSITFLSIGNQKSSIEIWNKFTELSDSKIRFISLGVLPICDISTILELVDYGVTTYPIEFWSKSGSIAAMLAHDLKVIAIGSKVNNELLKYRSNVPDNLIITDKIFEFKNFKKKDLKILDIKKYNFKIFEILYSNLN